MTDSDDNIERSVDSMTSTWLQRAREGNDDAWRRLQRVYRPLICWWCGKGGIPERDVDDVAQNVLAALASALANYEHQSFRGYLWTITRRKIQDYWRQQDVHPAVRGGSTMQQVLANVEAESSRSVGSLDQATRIVFDAVVQLVRAEFSKQDWQAYWLTAVEGKSPAEAAEILGVSRNVVYLARTRIPRRIRDELGDDAMQANE